ncbi:MAG: hypothetical protein HOM11_00310 [Methylococcales bacterium]|nr:hypothetical protein [Methylococcales bacterium]MBT7444688.1 hypothetical protein [Methylococcales bacterium]
MSQEIENYQQRIKNLETFKKLFFESQTEIASLKATIESLQTQSQDDAQAVEPSSDDGVELFDDAPGDSGVELFDEGSSEDSGVELFGNDDVELFDESPGNSGIELFGDDDELFATDNSTDSANVIAPAPAKPATIASDSEQIASLKANLESANQMAMLSMTSAGEMGTVMQFMRSSFECKKRLDLASEIFNALKTYGLSGSVRLAVKGKKPTHFSMNSAASNEHKQLLADHCKGDRIIDKGDCLIINFPYLSILVNQLPKDDLDKRGRISDNLVTLMSGANARMIFFNKNADIKQRTENLKSLIKLASGSLRTINEAINEQHGQNSVIMNELMSALCSPPFSSGISAAQKQHVDRVVGKAYAEFGESFSRLLKIDESFSKAFQQLEAKMA